MYEIVISMRDSPFSGKCLWKKQRIELYPKSLWRSVLTVEKRLFIPASGSKRFEDPFELLNPDQRLACSEELVTEVKHDIFITAFQNTLFHEYLHEYLKENKIHPWTCHGCKVGKCKLCNLTNNMIPDFWPS